VERFKFMPVTPNGLARLSHAACSGVTGAHMAQGGWGASRAKADDTTQSCQSRGRDWRLRGSTSASGHAPASRVTPMHMAQLLHETH
jgi:hypothetical protein